MTEVVANIEVENVEAASDPTMIFARKFVRLPNMTERRTRELYMSALADKFPAVRWASESAVDLEDVYGLVRACRQVPGATRYLVSIAREFAGDPEVIADLWVRAHQMDPVSVLTTGEREALVAALRRARDDVVAAAFRATVPTLPADPVPDAGDVAAVVHRVEEQAMGPDGLHPVFAFADYVAHLSGGTLESDLHAWSERTASAYPDVVRWRRAGLCETTRRELSSLRRYYLVAQLDPDATFPELYQLSVWLQQDERPEQPVLVADEPKPLAEVVCQIDDLLATVVPQRLHGQQEELIVELILPRSLIGEAVDQWPVDRMLFQHTLGVDYPLVIRSLERLRRLRLHAEWRKKWRWLKTNSHRLGREVFCPVSNHSPDEARRLHARLMRKDELVGLTLLAPPPAAPSLADDCFTAGLFGGVPVMLWCRDGDLVDVFRAQADELLDGRSVRDLPRAVLELRRIAIAQDNGIESNHIGRQIVLLWDDFDRIPSAFTAVPPLQAPPTAEIE